MVKLPESSPRRAGKFVVLSRLPTPQALRTRIETYIEACVQRQVYEDLRSEWESGGERWSFEDKIKLEGDNSLWALNFDQLKNDLVDGVAWGKKLICRQNPGIRFSKNEQRKLQRACRALLKHSQ